MSKPEKVFKMGAVRAAIFRNTIQRNGQPISLPKVVIEVRYRDKDGQWQGTNSLSLNDLPKAVAALQKAYEYLLANRERQSVGEATPPPPLPKVSTWEPGKGL